MFGAAAEYTDGKFSGEGHVRVDAGKGNKIFAGYGNLDGNSIETVGDFLDFGKYHLAVLGSFKKRNANIQFSRTKELLLNLGIENITKMFYRDDGTSRSFTGFLRFGKEGSNRYTPKAFDNDRLDFAERTLRHSVGELFDVPLQPANTHLSGQGTFALGWRLVHTPKSDVRGAEGYCTLKNRWIFGYGFSRVASASGIHYEQKPSAGLNIGPMKFVFGINNRKEPSFHLSFRRNLK